MKLTQKDYDARKARVVAGSGDDEDARLVKHYEANGFTTEGSAPQPAGDTDAAPTSTSARSRPTRGRN